MAVPGPLTPPASSPWPPPDPRTVNQYPRPKHQRTITAVLAVAVLAGVGVTVAGTMLATRGDGSADAPDEWDPRVAGVIGDIEEIRELEFQHPIAVTFLDEDDFVARVTEENDDATDAERDQADATEAMLRAFGLVEGDVDLFEERDQLAAEGVLGFYDPGTEELVVRGGGDDLDPMVTATVVHELTHALQDQYFDLDSPLEDPSAGASIGGRALIEADATFVEQTWVAQLPTEQRDEYERLIREFISTGADDGPPPVLEQSLSFPYVFGPVLHAALRGEGGLADVDEAFADYPVSEEQILFPQTYLAGDEPRPVTIPGEPDGDVVETGEYGAFGLFLVLAGRLDYAPALAAVDGWGGDAYRLVDRDDTRCVELAVAADTDADRDELVEAFEQWVDGVDGASVDTAGDVVVLASCDPGEAGLPPSTNRTETGPAFDALSFRAAIQAQVMTYAGLDLETATCVGDRFVDEVGVDRLGEINTTMNDDAAAELPDDVADAMFTAIADC